MPETDAKYDVFLSHSHTDAEAVERVAHRLFEQKLEVFLDKWVLIPGEKWQQKLARGLEQAKTCAVCLGAQTPAGWFSEEIQKALNRQAGDKSFRVIPVLLPGAKDDDVGDFLELRTWVRFSSFEDEYAFHLLICGIKGVKPGRWPDGAEREPAQVDKLEEGLMKLQELREKSLVNEEIDKEWQRKLLQAHFQIP